MIIEHEYELTTTNADPYKYVDVEGFDSISIESKMLDGTSFDSGVISVKKANCINGTIYSFGTPKTITATGLTELTLTDWGQAKFLVFEVTTASSGAARVSLTIHMKTLGFKIG